MTYWLSVLLWLLALYGSQLIASERLRYDKYRVYKLKPQTEQQLAILETLDGVNGYKFLDAVYQLNATVYVLVAPQLLDEFQTTLVQSEIANELIEQDAQRKLDEIEEPVADSNRRNAEDYSWSVYHKLDDTYNWLQSLSEKYPNQATLFTAGKTYEGRSILGLKISNGANRKAIFLECGMHAREWISPATATFITWQLLNSTDPEIRSVAENFDWYIVPHANPDGFVYTHTTERFWRKTRTPYGRCFGADPNRNWNFHWNEVGASNKPCSDTFAGPKAFSEIETRTLAEYISSIKQQLFMYISLHSYSQLLLFPYGYTGTLPPNHKDMRRVFDVAIKAVRRRYNTKYTGGNVYDAIYPAAGSTIDWAYGVLNVNYSYCYELRPLGRGWNGFALPANQIIPTGEETLDSIIAMINEASKS